MRINARCSHVVPKRIICCSQSAAMAHSAIGYDASKMVVIENGVETEVFAPDDEARKGVRRSLGIEETEVVIGLIGRFHAVKGHGDFLAAASHLRKQHRGVKFVLAGEGVDEHNPAIRALISSHGLEDAVSVLGARSDVPQLLSAMDIYTSCSYGEALPAAVAEAMSCAIPCVATDVGDSARLLGDTGTLFKPGDINGLVCSWQALIEMGEVSRRALGGRSRSRIEERFSAEAAAKRYALEYRNLV